MNKLIFFDCETNGKALNFKAPYTDTNNWPRIVQLAWAVYTADEKCERAVSFLVKPDGWVIPQEVVEVHGITTEMCEKDGIPIAIVLDTLNKDCTDAIKFIAHNLDFDRNVVSCEYHRFSTDAAFVKPPWARPNAEMYCTMKASTNFCRLPGSPIRGQFKWPKLVELHEKLFGVGFEGAHAALTDVQAMAKCYFELQRRLSGAKNDEGGVIDLGNELASYRDFMRPDFKYLPSHTVKSRSKVGLMTGAVLVVFDNSTVENWIPKSQLRIADGKLYLSNWFFSKLKR